MSDYLHDRHKFADAGLQLRLPVDLVPANQYSELYNALPVIEGELRTREGTTEVAAVYSVAAISVLGTTNSTTATLATTIYPHGFSSGDAVSITVMGNDPMGANTIPIGTYPVTITVTDALNFSFTPGIASTWTSGTTAAVFAQASDNTPGTALTNNTITNLFRLDEALPSIQSARIAAMTPGRLFAAPIPGGTAFVELVLPTSAGEPPSVQNGFSNTPFSIIGFRFTDDSASWAIIADSSKMAKFRYGPGNTILFFLLGNPIPLNPATAAAGASGNLNSTGGTDYDWRYTYYDGYVNTEGNPSASPDSGSVSVQTASLTLTPEPSRNDGGSFTMVNTAFGGVSNTGGFSSVLQSPVGTTINGASCRWYGFTNPAGTAFVTTLIVNWQVAIARPASAESVVYLNYSTDNGASFTNFAVTTTTLGQQNATVVLPLGTDLTQVIVECWGYVVPWSVVPPYSPTTGFTVTIANIEIDVNVSPTPNLLALVNQKAIVTVQLPGPLNDGRVTGIRLYRRGGSLPDAWRLVGTFPLSSFPATATLGPNSPVLGSNAGIVPTIQWTNPSNITSAVTFATLSHTVAAHTADVVTDWLLAYAFGLTLTSVEQLSGFTITFRANATTGTGVGQQFQVQLIKGTGGSTGVGTIKNFTMPAALSTITLGSATDLWGVTFAPADVNTFFGFQVRGVLQNTTGSPVTYDFQINAGQIAISVTGVANITDNIGDAVLEIQPILELDNDAPVTSVSTTNQPLSFIWGPVGLEARVLGCGDPNRPECVYFSKPGNPDAWPPENFIEVSDPGTPIIAGCTFNTRVYAFSRERVYELVEGVVPGVVFSPFVTPSAHGLFSPWGFAVGPSVYFIAKDGIYETTGGQEQSIVENDIKPLFPTYDTPGQAIGTYDAIDYSQPDAMRLRYYNDELYFLYIGLGGARQVLIYDILKKRWRGANYAFQLSEAYGEPNTVSSLLLGSAYNVSAPALAGTIYQNTGQTDPGGLPIPVVLRTGAHDQGNPLNLKQYGNVIFDLDPGGASLASPVTITPYINGEVASSSALTVTGTGRQQVPLDLSDIFAFNLEFQVAWRKEVVAGTLTNPVLYQYDTLYFMEPVQVTHWEAQPTSFEFPGFMHMRDAYIAIRSTSDVTLTLTIDNGTGTPTVQTYTVPSTSGVRRKQYIQFSPNKGLLYRLALDSVDATSQFRVYQSDLEVRVKPWLGVLGYAIQRTLGGEAQ